MAYDNTTDRQAAGFGFGASPRRLEDERFVRGAGTYLDDLDTEDALTAVIIRSDCAHGHITRLDTSAAMALEGVVAVLTGADAVADGLGMIPPNNVPTLKGEPLQVDRPEMRILPDRTVRYVGEAIGIIVARDMTTAAAALDLVEVEYDPLPFALSPDDNAAEPGYALHHGDTTETDAAFEQAAHRVSMRLINQRVAAAPMETRGALAQPLGSRHVITTGTQAPHLTRDVLARDMFAIPPDDLRLVTPDTGGGFGTKAPIYREQALVLWAARRLDAPVKWIASRNEGFQSDAAGRDMVWNLELALDEDGRFLGLRAKVKANMGAYQSLFGAVPGNVGLAALGGIYQISTVDIHSAGYFTHTTPVDAYRGAGRPEAIYALECLIGKAARHMGLSGFELRRRNLIPADAIPFRTVMGATYDSGDFAAVLSAAEQISDFADFPARRGESESRGMLRGFGAAAYVERAAGGAEDAARIELDDDGGADLMLGTMTAGQGHATAHIQLVSERLALDPARIRVHQGDTDRVSRGVGTFGSRSLAVGGSALHRAVGTLVEKLTPTAAAVLECAAADLAFDKGAFSIIGTDRCVLVTELASLAHADRLPGGIACDPSADGAFQPVEPTYPNGMHVAEVEIDPETGMVRLVGYAAVDDFGNEINPMMVDGQVHGGVGQGAGQALMEQVVYDPQSGQLTTGSFLDYAMPRATDFPDIKLTRAPTPCLNNPLGLKGCGEAGAICAPPSIMIAIMDALMPLGVTHVDMPATPHAVWRAIQAARGEAA
ncbi:MAG: xanthine dehydrogenase family protein molybdopterin-binding subunit [Minwuia sp.]|nr:xanthine dehydrogenase family protein molybdopterin-binding subunit [Minwuia sp.]